MKQITGEQIRQLKRMIDGMEMDASLTKIIERAFMLGLEAAGISTNPMDMLLADIKERYRTGHPRIIIPRHKLSMYGFDNFNFTDDVDAIGTMMVRLGIPGKVDIDYGNFDSVDGIVVKFNQGV